MNRDLAYADAVTLWARAEVAMIEADQEIREAEAHQAHWDERVQAIPLRWVLCKAMLRLRWTFRPVTTLNTRGLT